MQRAFDIRIYPLDVILNARRKKERTTIDRAGYLRCTVIGEETEICETRAAFLARFTTKWAPTSQVISKQGKSSHLVV